MKAKIDVRYLKEKEYLHWETLVTDSPQGSIYSMPEYLEYLCGAAGGSYEIVGCFRGDELVGGLGLYIVDSQRGRAVSNRWLLLYYNSIILKTYADSTPYRRTSNNLKALSAIEAFLSGEDYTQILLHNRHTLNDFRPFLTKGWSVQPRYSYLVDTSDKDKIWNRVDQNLRRLVTRCEESGTTLSSEGNFDRFYDMHVATHDRKGSPIYLPRDSFRAFFNKLYSRNLARLYSAILPDGTPVAAQLVLLGNHPVSHTVCAAADEDFLNMGATPYLRVKVFEDLFQKGYKSNDLTDASLDLPDVTRFKAQLGGELVTNFLLTKSFSLRKTRSSRPSTSCVGKATDCTSRKLSPAPRNKSFSELLAFFEENRERTAILSPDANPLTYGDVLEQTNAIVRFLQNKGFGKNDRIGVILPDGPEMALTLIGVMACASFVPLMENHGIEEYKTLITNIGIRVLIIMEGSDTVAISAASELNTPVITAKRKDFSGALLDFQMSSQPLNRTENSGLPGPDDIAMVLTTSGTTELPKIVPLTYKNVFSSAHCSAIALDLTNSDCYLHMMSMKHIAGITPSIITPLTVGASIVCTNGFSTEFFFKCLHEYQPTCFTAVPIMFKALAKVLNTITFDNKNCNLRFVRSLASPITEPLMEKFETFFGVPFLQAYGMTEALSISFTPLPPHKRKHGSVGVVFCPEVAILDESGFILNNEETGEVSVRAPYVFKGYENNPDANKKAFVNGWFRTGDLGYFDNEGYLYITGRVKEIINRGGEKVSPYEVEAALESHPAVKDGCVFGIYHDRLGEAVVAAVVLNDGHHVAEMEIRQHIYDRLTDYKVPQQVIFVDTIPKNDLGKVQRSVARDIFSPLLVPEFIEPETEMEKALAAIWRQLLDITHVGRHDNFFALGGDSLLATQVISQIKQVIGVEVPLVKVFQYTTLSELSGAISADSLDDIDEDDLSDLLEQIEGYSEEEVMERLNKKHPFDTSE